MSAELGMNGHDATKMCLSFDNENSTPCRKNSVPSRTNRPSKDSEPGEPNVSRNDSLLVNIYSDTESVIQSDCDTASKGQKQKVASGASKRKELLSEPTENAMQRCYR